MYSVEACERIRRNVSHLLKPESGATLPERSAHIAFTRMLQVPERNLQLKSCNGWFGLLQLIINMTNNQANEKSNLFFIWSKKKLYSGESL